MVEDIQRYILVYIYGYMLGYLQIYNKGCLDIHTIVSEIGTGGQIVEHSVGQFCCCFVKIWEKIIL